MKRKPLKLRTVISVLVIFFSLATIVDACPTCKDTLSENDANMVRGYFWSIVFMMSMPFLVLSGIATYFYLLVRKARASVNRTELNVAPATS